MKKYEFKTEKIHKEQISEKPLIKWLNEFGEDGWLLVDRERIFPHNPYDYYEEVILQREIK